MNVSAMVQKLAKTITSQGFRCSTFPLITVRSVQCSKVRSGIISGGEWTSHKNNPSPRILTKLQRLYGVSISFKVFFFKAKKGSQKIYKPYYWHQGPFKVILLLLNRMLQSILQSILCVSVFCFVLLVRRA